jgi:hypothetical protein
MHTVSLQAASDLLVTATITQTIDIGLVIAHKGTSADGTPFVLVNSSTGDSIIIKL